MTAAVVIAAVLDNTVLTRFIVYSILVQFVDEAITASNAAATATVVLRSH